MLQEVKDEKYGIEKNYEKGKMMEENNIERD
jgi:hypothetical protein